MYINNLAYAANLHKSLTFQFRRVVRQIFFHIFTRDLLIYAVFFLHLTSGTNNRCLDYAFCLKKKLNKSYMKGKQEKPKPYVYSVLPASGLEPPVQLPN